MAVETAMLNSDPIVNDGAGPQDEAAVSAILKSGAIGAIVLAGLATTIVMAIWFLFYFAVFLPRAIAS
jgi:hypothetical protein